MVSRRFSPPESVTASLLAHMLDAKLIEQFFAPSACASFRFSGCVLEDGQKVLLNRQLAENRLLLRKGDPIPRRARRCTGKSVTSFSSK